MASAGSVPAHLMQEVTIDSDYKEAQQYDNLADMFAIIRTLQFLELANTKQQINKEDYDRECDLLLQNFQSSKLQNGGDRFVVADFARTYNLDCPLALDRLKVGVNASRQYGIAGQRAGGPSQLKIASEVTAAFYEIIDGLQVMEASKENLKPLLTKLMDALLGINNLPPTFTGNAMIVKWLSKFESMSALDTLGDDDSGDLALELQEQYDQFNKVL